MEELYNTVWEMADAEIRRILLLRNAVKALREGHKAEEHLKAALESMSQTQQHLAKARELL
jgi:hypothetical protein